MLAGCDAMLMRKDDETNPNRLSVRIMGDEYVIRGQDASDDLAAVAASVESRLREVSEAHPKLAKTQQAVLVALRLAEELCRLRREHDEVLRALEEAR